MHFLLKHETIGRNLHPVTIKTATESWKHPASQRCSWNFKSLMLKNPCWSQLLQDSGCFLNFWSVILFRLKPPSWEEHRQKHKYRQLSFKIKQLQLMENLSVTQNLIEKKKGSLDDKTGFLIWGWMAHEFCGIVFLKFQHMNMHQSWNLPLKVIYHLIKAV